MSKSKIVATAITVVTLLPLVGIILRATRSRTRNKRVEAQHLAGDDYFC